MDASTLRKTTVRRGFQYGYHFLPAKDTTKPCLLFLHGFPSTSADWSAQFDHFAAKGYGLIIPDLLGYGETDSPKEYEHYDVHAMAKDVIDILDKENIQTVIGIGHDWGSALLARLANIFSGRFTRLAFLALGYIPPQPDFKFAVDGDLASVGLAYWELLVNKDGAEVVEKNIDSFYCLLFPEDYEMWKTHVVPIGALRNWVESDMRGPLNPNFDAGAHKKALLKKGFQGPTNWYKARTLGVNRDLEIPKDHYILTTPALFVGASRDYICVEEGQVQLTKMYTKNLTVESLDASHWVMFDKPKELNEVLERFITGV